MSKAAPEMHHLTLTDRSVLAARAESGDKPGRLVDWRVFPLSDDNHAEALREWLGVKKGRFARARCGVFPASRFLHRMVPDGPKAKDSAQLSEWLASTAKVDVAANEVAMLLEDGRTPEDDPKARDKALLFAGARTTDFSALQRRILDYGVYPTSLEVGTLPLLASIRAVSKAESRDTPAIVVELGDTHAHFHVVGDAGVAMTRQLAFGLDSMLPQVRAELGLSDDAVARKILYTNTFDFTEMAPTLLRRLLRELRSAIGLYETDTGVAPDRIYFANPVESFRWIYAFVAKSLNLEPVVTDLGRWAPAIGIELAESDDLSNADPALWSLFSLAGNYE